MWNESTWLKTEVMAIVEQSNDISLTALTINMMSNDYVSVNIEWKRI